MRVSLARPRSGNSRNMARLGVFLAFVLLSSAAQRPKIHIEIPRHLSVGNEYQATMSILSEETIPESYVKLSLPSALQILEGTSSYRGVLNAGTVEFRVRFRVTAPTDGVIMARVLALSNRTQVLAGNAEILYCHANSLGITVSSDDSNGPSTEKLTPQREAGVSGRRDRLMDAPRLVREDMRGIKAPLLRPDGELTSNSTVSGILRAGSTAVYKFSGQRGHRIWLSSRSSDFDTMLLLVAEDGTVVAENDDGAGILDSQIPRDGVLELSRDGTYFAVVKSVRDDEAGQF